MASKAGIKPTIGPAAAGEIDAKIAGLQGWRGEALAKVRALIREADPDVEETVKWGGTPVWEHGGIITTGEVYKDKIKLTFAKGASLPDPAGVFNGNDTGATRRSIDIREGVALNEAPFKALVQAAVAQNTAKAKA